MISLRRYITAWVWATALVVQAGCVSLPRELPPPPSEEMRREFGTVAVVSALHDPRPGFELPAKGAINGMGRGAAVWFGIGSLAPLAGIQGCSGDSTGLCAAFCLSLSVAGGAIGGLSGSVVGAVRAESTETVIHSEEVLRKAFASLNMQDALRDHVAQAGQSRTRQRIIVVPAVGPASPEGQFDCVPLAKQGIDTVVAVGLTEAALSGPWDVNPPLTLSLQAQAQVIRTVDGKELWTISINSQGNGHIFSEWAADNARLLHEDLDRANRMLADRIVDEIFLLHLIPPAEKPSPRQEAGGDNNHSDKETEHP